MGTGWAGGRGGLVSSLWCRPYVVDIMVRLHHLCRASIMRVYEVLRMHMFVLLLLLLYVWPGRRGGG